MKKLLLIAIFIFSPITAQTVNVQVQNCVDNGDGSASYDIYMQSDVDVYGFQFIIDPENNLTGFNGYASGGLAADAGFSVQLGANNGTVLGFSFNPEDLISAQVEFAHLTTIPYMVTEGVDACSIPMELIEATPGSIIEVWGFSFTFGGHIFGSFVCTDGVSNNGVDCLSNGGTWDYLDADLNWTGLTGIECQGDNPAGCFTTGCQENYDCVDDWEYYCVPTSCGCDENYGEWICTEDCNGGTCISQDLKGDFNHDGVINVLDIVLIVIQILEPITITPYQQWASDINNDGTINILDVVLLVNIILYSDEPVECIDYDGNVYQTVQIGDQLWMAENLKVAHYNDGSEIQYVHSQDVEPDVWENLSTGAYGYYNDDPSHQETYGNLYNWYAVDDASGICPVGWHVPSDDEYTVLTDSLGGESVAGGKIKEAGFDHWNSPNAGATNESGFTGLPVGYRNDYNSRYYDMGNSGYFWSSTEASSGNAWARGLHRSYSEFYRADYGKQAGMAVRCLKD